MSRSAGQMRDMMVRQPQAQTFLDFYVYTIDATVAAAGTASGSFLVDADSDFKLQKLTYFADIGAAAQTDSTRVIPLVSVLVTVTSSGRSLSSAAVPIASIFGTGVVPFILPTPKLFPAKATVSVSFSNFDAANAYNLKLAFIGAKVFKYPMGG